MNAPSPDRLDAALREIDRVFAAYRRPRAVKFCGFCYTPTEAEYFRSTPLDAISAEPARQLLVESADHWESTQVYKHYLPVILRRLVPPGHLDAMYPAHLLETLQWHRVDRWPEPERVALAEVGKALTAVLKESSDRDAEEWAAAWAAFPAAV
jgi:hypothetical protein